MGSAGFMVFLALLAFIPAVFALFIYLPPGKAGIVALLIGWLLLPAFDNLSLGLPLLRTKAMFISAVVLGANLFVDGGSWRRFRPRLLDLPIALLVLAPLGASLSNGLGAYDGLYTASVPALSWGVPYLLGRIYFRGPAAHGYLTDALVVAALAYSPLCLWEVRMSPSLHLLLYGFAPFGTDFTQVMRFGGYRPVVFMRDGLMTGMFLACSALIAYWRWRTGARRLIAGLPFPWAVGLLFVTTLLTKSTGAIILLGVGLLALEGTRRFGTRLLIVLLAAAPLAFCQARISGWEGEELVDLVARYVNTERAASIEFRTHNEDMLVTKALQQPWLGWGEWGRSRIRDASGKDISITDSMWIIALGTTGLVGLGAIWLLLALPPLALLWRIAPRVWGSPQFAATAAMAAVTLLWLIDNIFNSMLTPFFPAMAGSLVAFLHSPRPAPARPRSRGSPSLAPPVGPAPSLGPSEPQG
jgi:hypothetical protein